MAPPARGRSRSISSYSSRSRSISRSRSRSRSPIPRPRSLSPTLINSIIVQRLTKNVTKEHLEEIFGAYGKITDVDLPIIKRLGTHKGTAYITFSNEVSASKAISHMDRGQIDGQTIVVGPESPPPSPPPRRAPSPPPVRRALPPPTGPRGGRRASPPIRRPSPPRGGRRSRSPVRRAPIVETGKGRRRSPSYSRSRSPVRGGARKRSVSRSVGSYDSRSRSRSRSRSLSPVRRRVSRSLSR